MKSINDITSSEHTIVDESIKDIGKYIVSFAQKSDILKRIKSLTKNAGLELIRTSISLYYIMIDSSTPAQTKLTILGTLTYLVSPVDAVPDTLPGGLVDDIAVITSTYNFVKSNISPDIQKKTNELMKNWGLA